MPKFFKRFLKSLDEEDTITLFRYLDGTDVTEIMDYILKHNPDLSSQLAAKSAAVQPSTRPAPSRPLPT